MPSSPGNAMASPAGMPSPSRAAPALPDRNVSAETIEDAYVRFIFYCNPAVPPDADTTSLRYAFRSPPRSGGKVFHPYNIFGLVARFYAREVKTWTELTTLLGVEPPDPSKDESAQKVAQYGVRLKKWMNSMHVRAFFEYLLSMPNDYWTKVPSDASPIACPVRDGVAIEDDMALRALIPHIRPKRGRKRPEADDPAGAPALKARLMEHASRDDQAPRAAHVDSALDGGGSRRGDSLQTPLGPWPQSAITPSSRGSFWDDCLEPRSAVTPSRPRPSSHRRGPKNVSSAWKPGGLNPGAKQRGRPPTRTPVDGLSPASQAWKPTSNVGTGFAGPHRAMQPEQHRQPPTDSPIARPLSAASALQPEQNPRPESSRPSRPSISLQVPERQGGAVRLATPPRQGSGGERDPGERDPMQDASRTEQASDKDWRRFAKEATDAYEQASKMPGHGSEGPEKMCDYYFEKMEDRTNVDALVSYLVRSLSDSEWVDLEGRPDEAASVEESTALVNALLQNMYKTSTSPQAFLIQLAALAGSMTLVTRRPRCVRVGQDDSSYAYKCDWEYRFGHIKAVFTMPQCVPRTMWEKTEAGPAEARQQQEQQEQTPLTAEDWKRKYLAMVEEVHQRNVELADLRTKVMTSLSREWMES